MCPHCNQDKIKISKRSWPDGKFDYWCPACGRQVPEPEEITGAQQGQLTAQEIFAAIKPKAASLFPELVELTDVQEIGRLYRQGKKSFVDSVKWLIECGERLKTKKEKLAHGEWLPWLEANKEELGFGARTAQMLMDAASRPFSVNTKLATSHLTEVEALAISRQIWGNREPEQEPELEPESEPNDIEMEPEEELPEEFQEPQEPEPKPKPAPDPKRSSLFKPVANIPPPPKLDDNPRQCLASCCYPGGSEIRGPWNIHDAQSLLDDNSLECGHFGAEHAKVLAVVVEAYQLPTLQRLSGGMARDVIPARHSAYRGLDGGKAKR